LATVDVTVHSRPQMLFLGEPLFANMQYGGSVLLRSREGTGPENPKR